MKRHCCVMLLGLAAIAPACLPAAHASNVVNPCAGPSGLLGLLDRPTIADSSCVVPDGKAVLEAGIAAGNLPGLPGGVADTLPNLELRFGLPDQSEFVWLPPNYQYMAFSGQSPAMSGFGATTIGFKHVLGTTQHWQWTAEALATLPSGDAQFGSNGVGGAANAIVSYSSNGPLGVSFQMGVSSQTEPTLAGGQRYTSFNPDLVVTWLWNPRFQFYGEVYAQSSSGYDQGWGTAADGGIQYLINRNFEVDLEEGVSVQGNLGGFSNYTGAGLGVMF